MIKKVNEHAGFRYLLTEIQLCTFFLIFGIEYISQEVLYKIRDK